MMMPLAAELPVPPPDSWRENVAALVMDASGRVLLGLGTGSNAYWHFPQGGLNAGETQEEALRRELLEEAGLEPHQYRIITRYGGLRYRYRKNNDKSSRWRGQEQCYFLVLCHGEMPPADCSQTDEFCALTWVPWRELSLDLFAPVKRKIIEQVLSVFFPPLPEGQPLVPYLQQKLTPCRYLAGAAECCAADDKSLFGGGKEEMSATLARLALRLRAAHKALQNTGGRLLVLVDGAQGSGRKQCLRRLAAGLDALHLRVAEADISASGLPWELLPQLPPAGGVSLVLQQSGGKLAAGTEEWLRGQGITLLRLYLHVGEGTTGLPSSGYIIPSARRWYRDYVVGLLVADALESSALRAPSA